jgi:hypothetical protein
MTAQDKILYVANKLGLTSLQNMQASTGAVYDVDTDVNGQIFTSASRHQNPSVTNLTQNEFEVNEALLVETISFYVRNANNIENFQKVYGSNAVIVYSLVIGNKRVMVDTPIFGSGSPYTFATAGKQIVDMEGDGALTYLPRHQTFMEGAGVLIPPQVQWYVEYRIFDVVTGGIITPSPTAAIGCYLFGTRVLLNFNTSI